MQNTVSLFLELPNYHLHLVHLYGDTSEHIDILFIQIQLSNLEWQKGKVTVRYLAQALSIKQVIPSIIQYSTT